MKTPEEIASYLELALAEANESHDLAQDKQERLWHLIRAATIKEILDEITR